MHPGRAALLQFSTIDFEKIRLTEQRIFEARKAPNTQVAYSATLQRYIRPANVFDFNPLRDVL